MMPRTFTPPPRPSVVARFGPLTAVLVAVAVVAVLSSTGRVDSGSSSPVQDEAGAAAGRLPLYWGDAERNGTTADVDWSGSCDASTGRVEMPSDLAPPCVAARDGVESGATSLGVTADEVTVVLYEGADNDLGALLQDQRDSAEATLDTQEELIAMYADVFESWGRRIKVVPLKGSGSDATSSRADAVKVAAEIGAFASLGGPAQESAYAEELARRGVLCIGCGLAVPDSTHQEKAPFLWGNAQTPEQFLVNLGDLTEGLAGRTAEFAGSPEISDRERVFGVVYFDQDPPVFGGVEAVFAAKGAGPGVDAAVTLTYQLVLPDLPEKARLLVARLKEAGVTTVVFLGDPIMPIYLTKAATDQEYFPEWIITGTVLTDTTTFGRLYDQQQWSHAFGISSLPARTPRELGAAWRLYEWYYGEPPQAEGTIGLIDRPIWLFMLGIHMAGPDLTPETFRDGLFAYPPSGGTPLTPQVSFGDHGVFAEPDYLATDDMQLIWWDADAEGQDEQGTFGRGMMRSADGGRRYLPGELPSGPPNVFEDEGSVLLYQQLPADQTPPSYPSPGPGG